jgi:predicted enzyme related to lactoylglutathione lyase
MILLNIDVPEIAAAERFYVEAFGLAVGRRFGADFVEMLGWPVPLYLLRKEPGTIGAGNQARSYARHWTPVHADVVVPDLDAATARAARAGAQVEQAPQAVAFGRMARLADPFGNGFCLIEFSARGYDALLQSP